MSHMNKKVKVGLPSACAKCFAFNYLLFGQEWSQSVLLLLLLLLPPLLPLLPPLLPPLLQVHLPFLLLLLPAVLHFDQWLQMDFHPKVNQKQTLFTEICTDRNKKKLNLKLDSQFPVHGENKLHYLLIQFICPSTVLHTVAKNI